MPRIAEERCVRDLLGTGFGVWCATPPLAFVLLLIWAIG